MKNSIKTLFALSTLTASASAATTFIDLQLGTDVLLDAASGVTYTVTSTTPADLEDNGNGDLGINPADSETVTITFTGGPVDIMISSTDARYGNVFDGGGGTVAASELVTNGSNWTFVAGTNASNAIYTSVVGQTFGLGQTSGQLTSGSQLDWGTLTSSGVTQITWNLTGNQREVVKFQACASPVPEPSSAALLGLGGLALLRRRRK